MGLNVLRLSDKSQREGRVCKTHDTADADGPFPAELVGYMRLSISQVTIIA